MKILAVIANNRKRCFAIKTKSSTFEYPFHKLTLKPNAADPVTHVESDSEIAHEGFSYALRSGKRETIHIEQILEHSKDPDYVVEKILYSLTLKAQELIRSQKIRKRALARGLNTSPAQLYRLLDQTFYGKSIDQMVRLLYVLGHSVQILTKKAA